LLLLGRRGLLGWCFNYGCRCLSYRRWSDLYRAWSGRWRLYRCRGDYRCVHDRLRVCSRLWRRVRCRLDNRVRRCLGGRLDHGLRVRCRSRVRFDHGLRLHDRRRFDGRLRNDHYGLRHDHWRLLHYGCRCRWGRLR
jgi:hypothetical protein